VHDNIAQRPSPAGRRSSGPLWSFLEWFQPPLSTPCIFIDTEAQSGRLPSCRLQLFRKYTVAPRIVDGLAGEAALMDWQRPADTNPLSTWSIVKSRDILSPPLPVLPIIIAISIVISYCGSSSVTVHAGDTAIDNNSRTSLISGSLLRALPELGRWLNCSRPPRFVKLSRGIQT